MSAATDVPALHGATRTQVLLKPKNLPIATPWFSGRLLVPIISTDFSDVRIEAQEVASATLRWTYGGAGTISIYRSTNGTSYSLLTTVAASVDEYVDEELDDGTIYYYRLSDDAGVTKSPAVFVVTYVSLVGRVANTTSFNLPSQSQPTPGDWGSLVEVLESHTVNNDSLEPCTICSFNHAIVINCSTECAAFKIVLTEDINSISVVGCDPFVCPIIEFITPPDESYGVCGWPVGCDFIGDECFTAPTDGGPNGNTSWSNGINFPGMGNDIRRVKSSCPCPPAQQNLVITCCSDSCDMECGEETEVQLKACGGLAPYTWEIDGPATLSATKGTNITVSRANAGEGFAGQTAFMDVGAQVKRTDSGGSCPDNGGITAVVHLGTYHNVCYECDGTSSSPCIPPATTTASYTIQGHSCGLSQDPEDDGPYETTEDVSTLPINHNQAEGSSPHHFKVRFADVTRGYDFTTPLGIIPVSATVVNTIALSRADVRTAAMKATGLCTACAEGQIVVTVTDAALRSATRILAVD